MRLSAYWVPFPVVVQLWVRGFSRFGGNDNQPSRPSQKSSRVTPSASARPFAVSRLMMRGFRADPSAASRQRLKRLSRSRIRPFVVGRVLQYGKYLLRGLRPVSRLHEGPYEPQVVRVIQEPVVRRRLPSVSPHPSEEVEHDAVLSSMSPIIGPCRHRVPPTRRFGATMACESSGRRKGRLRTWNRGP